MPEIDAPTTQRDVIRKDFQVQICFEFFYSQLFGGNKASKISKKIKHFFDPKQNKLWLLHNFHQIWVSVISDFVFIVQVLIEGIFFHYYTYITQKRKLDRR